MQDLKLNESIQKLKFLPHSHPYHDSMTFATRTSSGFHIPEKRKHDIMITAQPLFPHLKNPNSVTFATCAFSAFHISMQFSGGQGNAQPCNKIINHHHKNHHHHKNIKTSPNCQRGRLPSRFRLPKLSGG